MTLHSQIGSPEYNVFSWSLSRQADRYENAPRISATRAPCKAQRPRNWHPRPARSAPARIWNLGPVRRKRGESHCDEDQCAVSAVRQRLIGTMTVEIDPVPPGMGAQRRVRALNDFPLSPVPVLVPGTR